MKQIININLSKDTPAETLAALYAKAQNVKQSKRKQPLYLFNEDIEKLNDRYEELFKKVKNSLNLSEVQIQNECEILSQKYFFEIEELSKSREVDYKIKLAEIEARAFELKPWRRCWLWRLLFRPLTNRAQDIIEARAELDADVIHSAAEKALDADSKAKVAYKKLTKRELKRIERDKLKAVIEKADTTDTSAAFDEPADVPPEQEQPQEQLRLDVMHTATRRPRPPRSCRK